MAKTTVRAPMPPSQRAKQFAPFDALKGLKEAIACKEHAPEPRRELSEDAIAEINTKLTMLKPGSWVTVVYYCDYTQEVHQITGQVSKVDPYWQTLKVGISLLSFLRFTRQSRFPRVIINRTRLRNHPKPCPCLYYCLSAFLPVDYMARQSPGADWYSRRRCRSVQNL